MRVGVVAEGTSEFLLLEALIDRYLPGSEVRRIQPDVTLAAHLGAGWKGVRAWCRENGTRLEVVMRGLVGDELDVLIIHVDCSMAPNVDAERGCPPASATADALQSVVREHWLQLDPLPGEVVLMTPAQTTDTWFFVGDERDVPAALEPLECSLGVEHEFARLRVYRWKRGEIKKTGSLEPLARATAANWDAVLQRCSQASRFWGDFAAATGIP